MLQCPNDEESREIREFLRDSGYNTQALAQHFGQTDNPQLHRLKLQMVGITLEPNRLNTLFRWFWIGSPVEEAAAREVIPERILQLLLRYEVVVAEEGQLTAVVRITPFQNLLIFSDHDPAGKRRKDPNMVVWPNPTSQACYNLASQTPVGRTLDLGAGNGILALAAALHSDSVVATDLNPRAREFCLFNAALNGFGNIEFREGSAFEPVRGERFDQILSNPPFFVTPTVRQVYSDNSMELDGFCRSLVRDAPGHLNENGYCQMLAEWVELKGQPWRERLGEWFAGIGCDVWVMTSYMRSAVDYALIRVEADREHLTDADVERDVLRSWHEYFERHQVQSIYGGMIVLRRREGTNWVRMEELQSTPERPFGDFLRRIFENRDALGAHGDEGLLEMRPLLAPSVRLQQRFVVSPEGWQLASVDMQVGEGLGYSLAVQPQVADFVALCDGKRTLRESAAQLAARLSVDPAIVQRESCGIIRRLADRGMILIKN